MNEYKIKLIVSKHKDSKLLNDLSKNKFLVPPEYTAGYLLAVIRKMIKLTPDQAIFLFIHQQEEDWLSPGPFLLNNAEEFWSIYQKYGYNGEPLKITFHEESVFG